MEATTIKLQERTKEAIDTFREHKNESYDEVLQKIIFIVKNVKKDPELSKETVDAIEKARERIRKGQYITEAQAKKRLGL